MSNIIEVGYGEALQFGVEQGTYIRIGSHDAIESIRAENEALKQQVEQGKRDAVPEWLPIETAPKDCGIMGYQRMSEDTWIIAPMYWSGSEWLIIQFHSDNTEHSMQPTHWQPIAAAPKQEK